MIPTEDLARGLATEVPRPSGRSFELPHGPSDQDRAALVKAIAEGLLEINSWLSSAEIGDSSYLVLETSVAGKSLYAQFLSAPGEATLLCEFDSGFYTDASSFRPSPEQRQAMVSHGFSDGLTGNFRKELVFDAPDAATTIAEQTIAVLGNVLGWSPEAPITAKLQHERRLRAALVFDGLSRDDALAVLARHGLEARSALGPEPSPDVATVDAAAGGVRFTLQLQHKVENSARFARLTVLARVGERVAPHGSNPFNALTGLGRSWVRDGVAYLEETLRVVGITGSALHEWLRGWEIALATARYWYRRVELSDGAEVTLALRHFDPRFHNLLRIARSHVKPAAEEAAIAAFFDSARAPEHEADDGIDAWAFFEGYAAAHPDEGMPIEAKFVSSASAADIVSWLERIDGVEATLEASGDLEIRHAVPGGTLRVSPASVRRVAMSPQRFALSVTIERRSGQHEVQIGTDDFYFAPDEARIDIEGIELWVPAMPPCIGWFETKQRLRAVERELAWAGPLPCGASIAWLCGALAGAERVGIVCTAEQARLASVLEGARRSIRVSRGFGKARRCPHHPVVWTSTADGEHDIECGACMFVGDDSWMVERELEEAAKMKAPPRAPASASKPGWRVMEDDDFIASDDWPDAVRPKN
jgi:hypothetical protein